MTYLGLAESFNTMNRSDPTGTLFDVLFLGKYERKRLEILTQPSFKSSIYAIKILKRYLIHRISYLMYSLKTIRFSVT